MWKYFERCNLIAAVAALIVASPSLANDEGDVPFVPTSPETVQAMLDTARVGPKDFVIDLGSGDGRIVIAAARRGARAMGVDLDQDLLKESRANARAAGVEDRVTFRRQDLFETDLSKATVLTMYLLPGVNLQLRDKILTTMKPGSRVVSHDFTMGDWEPDQSLEVGGDSVFLWIVPARVSGPWSLTLPDETQAELELTQAYQSIAGTIQVNGTPTEIEDATLIGDRISFDVPRPEGGGEPLHFEGQVEGSVIEGSFSSGQPAVISRAET